MIDLDDPQWAAIVADARQCFRACASRRNAPRIDSQRSDHSKLARSVWMAAYADEAERATIAALVAVADVEPPRLGYAGIEPSS